MRKTIVAGLLAGLAIFIWNSVAWMALPHHRMVGKEVSDSGVVLDFLKSQDLETGVYFFPGMTEMQTDQEKVMQIYREGDFVPFMVYTGEPKDPMMVGTMIIGFIYLVLAGWLTAELLTLAKPRLKGRGQEILFVLGLALFATLTVHMTQVNWFYFPLSYVLMDIVDLLVGWLIGGFIISWWLGRTPKGGEKVAAAA
ncbi:hypothetical protein KQI63_03855 [bacterium]|nr:hypothetical protein [bacterium]